MNRHRDRRLNPFLHPQKPQVPYPQTAALSLRRPNANQVTQTHFPHLDGVCLRRLNSTQEPQAPVLLPAGACLRRLNSFRLNGWSHQRQHSLKFAHVDWRRYGLSVRTPRAAAETLLLLLSQTRSGTRKSYSTEIALSGFCDSIIHRVTSEVNLSVRAMDNIAYINETMKRVDEFESGQPIAIDEGTWTNNIAKFLTVSEALRLRVVATPFNNDYICGEYGPLLFFLSRNMSTTQSD